MRQLAVREACDIILAYFVKPTVSGSSKVDGFVCCLRLSVRISHVRSLGTNKNVIIPLPPLT